ncbi:MAG: hypothetical protein IT577_00795 [Verrucomicrobiae bacterium]|nr:hypothetical protein [Verrucomicrobiae bacterium]
MSLKYFHLVFVNAALLLAGWFCWWSWGQYRETGSGLGYAIGSAAVALALAGYEAWFFKKSKNLDLE